MSLLRYSPMNWNRLPRTSADVFTAPSSTSFESIAALRCDEMQQSVLNEICYEYIRSLNISRVKFIGKGKIEIFSSVMEMFDA